MDKINKLKENLSNYYPKNNVTLLSVNDLHTVIVDGFILYEFMYNNHRDYNVMIDLKTNTEISINTIEIIVDNYINK